MSSNKKEKAETKFVNDKKINNIRSNKKEKAETKFVNDKKTNNTRFHFLV